MITIIYGPPRVGKTALMTKLAIDHLQGLASQDVMSCKRFVKQMNLNEWNLTAPLKHMVFSDYLIKADRKARRCNYEIDGYYLGLPNKRHPTLFLPPYSQIYLDEAQKYYNSRMSKYLSAFVSRFYEVHGHNNYNITMTCQRPGLIDVNIRELAQFIEVVELKHKMKDGSIVSSTWTCKVIEDEFKMKKYLDSGKTNDIGDIVKYKFDGNIFNHYNSFNNRAAFFKDRYEQNFDLIPGMSCGISKSSMKQFNELHDYTVPDTYYDKKGGKN